MSFLVGSQGGGNYVPNISPPPPPPPPISPASSGVQAAGAAVRQAAAGMSAAGLNQNVVTGPQGAPNPTTTGSRTRLSGEQ